MGEAGWGEGSGVTPGGWGGSPLPSPRMRPSGSFLAGTCPHTAAAMVGLVPVPVAPEFLHQREGRAGADLPAGHVGVLRCGFRGWHEIGGARLKPLEAQAPLADSERNLVSTCVITRVSNEANAEAGGGSSKKAHPTHSLLLKGGGRAWPPARPGAEVPQKAWGGAPAVPPAFFSPSYFLEGVRQHRAEVLAEVSQVV